MFTQEGIQLFIDGLVRFATDLLIPFMFFTFLIAVVLRFLVFWTLKRQETFAVEFEKRKNRYLDGEEKETSFFMTVKKILLKTYYEMFVTQALLQRRKADPIMTWSDRIFLTRGGFAWLVKDVLRQIRYLKFDGNHPKMMEISKNTFQHNPFFNNVFGRIPSRLTTDLLNILPGMFIIGGIFGTFLGIMKALPDLSGMNLADIEASKAVIDQFLLKISFSMSTSLVGILLSVLMSIVNAIWSPQKLFVRTIDRFENTLNSLWSAAQNNRIPPEGERFDENQNPIEALAETALDKDYSKLGHRSKGKDARKAVSLPKEKAS